MILALDTSTLTASAAVVTAAGEVVAALAGDPAEHSDRVLALCAAVLERAGIAAADLDAIAVGAGPGSFTGLRIGLATGKGLAYAIGRPLWLASSLAALAWDLAAHVAEHGSQPALEDAAPGPRLRTLAALESSDALLVPVLDARRGELYAGFYRRTPGGLVAAGPERVLPPADLAAAIAVHTTGAVHLAGDALTVHAAALAALPATRWPAPSTPSAAGVARAALAGDRVDRLATGAPAYIRPSEAEVKYPSGVPGAQRR